MMDARMLQRFLDTSNIPRLSLLKMNNGCVDSF
jgi:hypothetical protein